MAIISGGRFSFPHGNQGNVEHIRDEQQKAFDDDGGLVPFGQTTLENGYSLGPNHNPLTSMDPTPKTVNIYLPTLNQINLPMHHGPLIYCDPRTLNELGIIPLPPPPGVGFQPKETISILSIKPPFRTQTRPTRLDLKKAKFTFNLKRIQIPKLLDPFSS
ncbi:conserved hypothetical protein [Ricinus communis]|uniref:Uncharacterized protein n=1 Tax=Ricinus communis TaxID=3988 RepID=B9RVF5_RICCO|nr:conserved hypothetical protein [Ricinus communis]